MSLEASRDGLYSANKKLMALWETTEPYWQDTMKAQFVEEVLTPLQEQVAAALQGIDRMEGVLHQMRRECEGNPFDIFGGGEDGP
jgi:hypothetical protein